MGRIEGFADGVHVDFADGNFAPTQLLGLDESWRSEHVITHVHVMFQDPLPHVAELVSFEPDLVIVHAESDNVRRSLEQLREAGVRTGVALLPETELQELQDLDLGDLFDHVLVFAGHLGHQGGTADLQQLDKVRALRANYPDVEIGWDGGVSIENVQEIAAAGVDVLNVGGAIKNADDPEKAYDTLVSLLS